MHPEAMAAERAQPLELRTRDGLRLFGQRWKPADAASASVVVVHGFGEHSGRYAHVAGWLSSAGFEAITFDLRGHGRSEGSRGHFNTSRELVADLETVIKASQPGIPLFVYGHSFGAQPVLLAGIQHKLSVRGVIASAPWIHLAFDPPRWRVVLASVMSNIWPTFTQSTTLRLENLSHDISFVESIQDPALSHRTISARAYFESVRTGEELARRAAEWTLPLLCYQGDEDCVTSLEATRRFFSACSSADKQLIVYPGFRHEPHNEVERERVRHDLVDWIRKRL